MPTFRSACPYDCPEGCSLLVETDGEKIAAVTGDPANPYTAGTVCGKMGRLPEAVNSPERILTPLRRAGAKGEGRFVPISWKEALEEISTRWKALMAQYGPETILPCSYAGTMGAVQRHCGEGFFHDLGASGLVRTLCSSGKSAGWESVMGASCDLSPWEVGESDLILLWSTDVAATRLHLGPIIRGAKSRGARVVLIDVFENGSAPLADEVLLVRPGTDGALALAMLHVLDTEGLTDEGWLAEHAAGWTELRSTLGPWTAERAGALTGLDPAAIRALALAYGRAKAPCIVAGSGFSRSGNGGEAARAIAALPAAVGAWGKRGGGTYGFCSAPALVDKGLMKRPWKTDQSRQRVNINRLGPALLGEGVEVPIHALYVYHGNPAAVLSDQNGVRRGLAREDLFTVVHERYMTDTARFADLILPAPYMVETEDLYTPYGYRQIQCVRPVVLPPGEVKSNWEVFCLLAAALGVDDPHYRRSAGELCRELVEGSAALTAEEKARVLAGEPVVLEAPFPLPIGTADGKVHLADPAPITWHPPHGGPEPFRLVCAPSVHTLNSSFNEIPAQRERRGERTVRMNRADAAALGLAHGDRVVCANDLGETEALLALDRAVAPGAVVAQGVYPGADGINSLTHPRLSDLGEATTLNDNTVTVGRR